MSSSSRLFLLSSLALLAALSLACLGDRVALAADPGAADSVGAARDTVYVLPGLSVEERRALLERDLSLRLGFAAAYRTDQLPSPTTTTSELLAQGVGVHVRQFGGLGSYSAVSVRGSSASQVAFYLDGVPLNQGQYGVVNAADLPLAALERVEVYRGTAPLALANPGAGVVRLVTRQIAGRASETRVSYGRFDTRQASSWGSWSGRRVRLLGAYQFQASRGAFSFLDDNGTPFNPNDDERVPRRNNVFGSDDLTLVADLPLAGRITAGIDVFAKRAGMPGISSYQSSRARFRTERGVASLTWASPAWLRRRLELSTQLFGVGARDRFRDLENELGSGIQDTDDRSWSWGARQRAALAAGPLGQTLEAVLEARREQFQPRARSPEPWTGPTSRRAALDLGLSERIEPLSGRLVVEGYARRQSTFDGFPAGPAYAVAPWRAAESRTIRFTQRGAGLRARLHGELVLKMNAARLHRVPSLFELFGDRGTVVGNRDLVPERQDTRDVGLSWSLRRASDASAPRALSLAAEIAAYRTDARDLILFIQNSQRASVAQNVSSARLEGLETSLSGRWRELRLTANWTAQSTRDRSEAPHWRGRELPGRPDHEGLLRLEYARGRWRAFHELEYVGGNFLDRANRQSVPARRIHNSGAGLSLARDALRLTAEIRNLADDRVQDAAAYPLPGRVYAITVEVRL